MEKKDALSKILAVAGSALAWIPILAPLVISVLFLVQSGLARFDYLMPAELFPIALLGGIFLLTAALRMRKRRALIGWSLGLAVVLLFGMQALAVVTGLASGATKPAGWPLALVVASLAGYVMAVVALGIGGILILRDVFGKTKVP
jgi:hypothetical protein